MSSGERERRSLRQLLPPEQYQPFFVGLTAGISSTLVLHPLDLLKIRLAVNDGQLKSRPQYKNIRNAFQTIRREEGVKGFYRGVAPNCLSAGFSWGLYFLFYETIKDYMLEGSNQAALGPWNHLFAAAQAGILTQLLTNPISTVRTRLCLQYADHYMNIPNCRRYSGMVEAFQKVYKYEGLNGLYRGLVPGLFNVSHGAVQFMLYEEIKETYAKRTGSKRMATWEYLGAAAASKLVASATFYPFQLVRARLQDQHQQYSSVIEVAKTTWEREGLRGFYKGLLACSMHVLPNICIVFLIYEHLSPSSD